MRRTTTTEIVVDLTEAEVRDRSVTLAQGVEELATLEQGKRDDAKLNADRIKFHRETLEKLGEAVRWKQERRTVKIERRRIGGKVQTIIVETGELLSARMLTPDERAKLNDQGTLFDDEELDDGIEDDDADAPAGDEDITVTDVTDEKPKAPGTVLKMVAGGAAAPSAAERDGDDDGNEKF